MDEREPGGLSGGIGHEDCGEPVPAAGVSSLLARWTERVAPSASPGEVMPQRQALDVLEAVLGHLRGALPDRLEPAGRAWGRAHRSVSEMVEHLSHLRAVLTDVWVQDQLKMHRALDRVTSAATEEVMARLERVSRTDALTGVGNRRAFNDTIHGTLSGAARQGHDVTVVAVDLDGLKRINDTQGHAAGDAALTALVRAFFDALRDEDMIFRVGGDEFVIVLPFTSVSAAEALMRRVSSTDAPAFTWGAAGYPRDGSDASELVDAADRDLYRRRGIERVVPEAPRSSRRVAASLAAPTGRLESTSRLARWAWVPAAGVLGTSLIAVLLSTTSAPNLFAGRGGHIPPAASTTEPIPSGGPTTVPSTAASGAGPSRTVAPSSSTSSTSSKPSGSAFLTRYTQPGSGEGAPTSTTGSYSPTQTENPGGASGGPSPSPAPPASPTGYGGALGALSDLLDPVPVVGGNGGLLSLVDQLLAGPPPSPGSLQVASDPLVGGSTSLLGALGGH